MSLTEYDDLLFPEAPAERTTQYLDAASVLTALDLTHTSVTAALSSFEQEDLGAEEEAAATRALSKAAWWFLAKLRNTRHILEDYLPSDTAAVAELVVSRAVYELMLSTGQSGRAAERRVAIEEMALALFGAEFKPAESSTTPGSAVGVVAIPRRKRYPE